MIQTSRDRDNSGRVRTPEKNSGETVGHNNAKHFLCPISSQHSLEFLKITFFEGKALGTRLGWAEFATKVRNNRLRSRWALHFSDFFFFCHGSRFSPIKTTQKQTIMSCTWGISYLKVFWTSDIIDYLVLTSNRQHVTEKFPHVQTNQTKQLRWEFLIKTKCKSSLFNLDSVQFWYELNRGGGYSWGFLLGGVPPSSQNPDPISDQIMSFSRPVFRPDL